ncbi:Hint domain-containing protein, partial [Falsiroseomonas sp.]|uniref:Hint domain-containing protein n=1 Tax=Falsiroseomonas sp. TaxID=2870721 RepID=UPI0034A186A1
TISGGEGADTINAGNGGDSVEGGIGADSINAGNGADTVFGGDDADTIIATGDTLADVLFGDGGNDSISAGGGADSISGGDGADSITGGNGADSILGDDGADMLVGGNGNDTLLGGEGDDSLDGNGGNGDDSLDGGNGVDSVSFSGSNASATVNLVTGIAVTGFGNDTLRSIENVTTGGKSDTVIGDDEANRLVVGDGQDSVRGGGGNDTIFGGSGFDTIGGGAGSNLLYAATGAETGSSADLLTYADASGPVSGTLAENVLDSGTIRTSTFTQGADADTVGGFMNVTGSALDDTLAGNSGNNILSGGAGNDVLDGGEGIDWVAYGDASGAVSVDLGAGTSSGADGVDAITNVENASGSASNDTLIAGESGAAQAEGLITGSRLDGLAGDDSLIGAGLRDDLRGGEGNDTLAAGAGVDALRPGSGNDSVDGGTNPVFDLEGNERGYRDAFDSVVYDDATGGVLVDLGAGETDGAAGRDTLVGIEEAVGGQFADTLIGSDGDDAIRGTGGDDTADGGNGNDWLSYLGAGNAVLADFGAGTSFGAGADSFANFENLMGGAANDTLIGDAGDNIIDGWRGSDSLVGGGGIDTADFRSADGAVQVTLVDGAGAATVNGPTVSTDTLEGFENVYGGRFADTIGGDTGANFLSGGAGNDQLAGGDGADTLHGGSGDDSLAGGTGDDIASYVGAPGPVVVDLGANTASGWGNDTLANIEGVIGSAFDDTLTGGSGDNTLIAGDGDDQVSDGGGSNSLDGGAGNDTLTFSEVGFYNIVRGVGDELTITYLGADSASAGSATNTAVNFEEFSYNAGTFNLTAPGWDGTDILYVCFASGTRILTATGEVAVEQLRPGDPVVTLAGRGLPVKPVLWVGRRHVVLAGRADAAEMAPIRIKAGALGPNTPKRDLLVSPDHCLHLDGALVPARLLVNGRSVVAEIGMAEVTWYHVELETHEVLVAEGAAAESWLDCGNRSWFQNAPVALLTVPGNLDAVGTGWDATRACAPLVHGGEQLARIRAAIEARTEEMAGAAGQGIEPGRALR